MPKNAQEKMEGITEDGDNNKEDDEDGGDINEE
jgi:hypothetical protein